MTHDHAADIGVAVAVVTGLVTDRLAGHALAVATAIPHEAIGPLATVLVGGALKLIDAALRRREARAAADDAERVARASAPSGPPRVLVVEDDETGQLIAMEAAVMLGVAVEHALTARDAFRALASDRQIRVVLLDLGLSDAGHVETFARHVRDAAPAGARVIVTSGRADAARVAEAIGADGCLLKPFSIDTLADAMRAALT